MKDRELFLAQNVRLIERATLPNFTFVGQSDSRQIANADRVVRVSHSNTKTQSLGVVLGARSRQSTASGNVVLGGFEPFFRLFRRLLVARRAMTSRSMGSDGSSPKSPSTGIVLILQFGPPILGRPNQRLSDQPKQVGDALANVGDAQTRVVLSSDAVTMRDPSGLGRSADMLDVLFCLSSQPARSLATPPFQPRTPSHHPRNLQRPEPIASISCSVTSPLVAGSAFARGRNNVTEVPWPGVLPSAAPPPLWRAKP